MEGERCAVNGARPSALLRLWLVTKSGSAPAAKSSAPAGPAWLWRATTTASWPAATACRRASPFSRGTSRRSWKCACPACACLTCACGLTAPSASAAASQGQLTHAHAQPSHRHQPAGGSRPQAAPAAQPALARRCRGPAACQQQPFSLARGQVQAMRGGDRQLPGRPGAAAEDAALPARHVPAQPRAADELQCGRPAAEQHAVLQALLPLLLLQHGLRAGPGRCARPLCLAQQAQRAGLAQRAACVGTCRPWISLCGVIMRQLGTPHAHARQSEGVKPRAAPAAASSDLSVHSSTVPS